MKILIDKSLLREIYIGRGGIRERFQGLQLPPLIGWWHYGVKDTTICPTTTASEKLPIRLLAEFECELR